MTKLEETRAKLADLYAEAAEIIDTSVEDPFSVADLCEVLECSVSRLYKAFIFMSGYTPGQYIINARKPRMIELVETTTLNNTEMAERLCVANNTFTNEFKKHTGMTVTEYRRKLSYEAAE